MKYFQLFSIHVLILIISIKNISSKNVPIVVTTWAYTNSTIKAWDVVNRQQRSAVSVFDRYIILEMKINIRNCFRLMLS